MNSTTFFIALYLLILTYFVFAGWAEIRSHRKFMKSHGPKKPPEDDDYV